MDVKSEMEIDVENCNLSANGVISKEIGEINLAYMLLAQKLVKQDRAEAMFRLGVGRELADLLANMSLSQIVKLAASNFLLCSFRLDDRPMFAVVGEGKEPAGPTDVTVIDYKGVGHMPPLVGSDIDDVEK